MHQILSLSYQFLKLSNDFQHIEIKSIFIQCGNLHQIMIYLVNLSMLFNKDFIARTHRCVRYDSEMHEAMLLDCTTGDAGSAIQ